MAATPNFGWPTPDDNDLVSEGAQAIRALGDAIDGSVTALGVGFRFAGTVYFTSSGTFLKADPLGTGDIGLRAIRVRCVGGGGGGGGTEATGATTNSVGGGGGGGAYTESLITDIAGLDASVTVTVSLGGTSGAFSNGGFGGTSSFGTLVTAPGGVGGLRDNALTSSTIFGGAGGNPGTGDRSSAGNGGGFGIFFSAGQFRAIGGSGGGSVLGGGARNIRAVADGDPVNGENGRAFGGGGGGAAASRNCAAASGGAGGPGIVIVDCFV